MIIVLIITENSRWRAEVLHAERPLHCPVFTPLFWSHIPSSLSLPILALVAWVMWRRAYWDAFRDELLVGELK